MGVWTPGPGPTSGDDTFVGDAADDNVNGFGGNDTLDGNGGIDRLEGGSGNDTLSGGIGGDLLLGNDGDDVLLGGEDFDFLFGHDGADELSGGPGGDLLNGGEGDDTLLGGDGTDELVAGAGVDHVDGGEGLDFVSLNRSAVTSAFLISTADLASSAGTTLSDGTTLRNIESFNITTGSGADTLIASDALVGQSVFNGGAGLDTFVADMSTSEAPVNLSASRLSTAHFSFDLLSVEHLVVHGGLAGDDLFGGLGDDTLSGGAGSDRLFDTSLFGGGQGNDRLSGGAGDDQLGGGPGDDIVDGGAGDDQLGADEGVDTVDGGGGVDLVVLHFPNTTADTALDLTGMETAVGATLENGTIIRNVEEFDVLTGFGNDTLAISGDDLLVGSNAILSFYFASDGSDRLIADFSAATLSVLLSNSSGHGDFTGASMFLQFQAVEHFSVTGGSADDFLNGFAGNDVFHGGAGNDNLQGAQGDDLLIGGLGDDGLTGGEGTDLVSYIDAPGGVIVWLAVQGIAQDTGSAGTDTLVGFERLEGSAFFDILTGSAGDDSIAGLGGDDILNGQGGADQLQGGDGDDRFVQNIEPSVDRLSGEAGFDTLDFGAAGAGVIVQMSGYATTGAGALLALFSGVEGAVGGGFDDALIGTTDNNRFDGGAGSDWIVGGGGDDWFVQRNEGGLDRLFGDAGADTIDWSASTGPVTVQLSGYATFSPTGALAATFAGIENVIGSGHDDALIGNAANNRITGAGGSDWLVGGGGDDWFVQGNQAGIDRLFGGAPAVDSGIDTIDYSSANAAVTVQLNGWSSISGGATLATFTGIENAVGSAFNDALIGNASHNRMTGGQGADWLVGQAGDDTFLQNVDTTAIDRLFGDAGADTIDYSSAGAAVVVQLSGYATTNGGGSITLATFTGIENAVGSSFADALIGNGFDNRITGAGGIDWLVGGGGADTFVYQAVEATRDSIRDFTQLQDRIDLAAIDANASTAGDDSFVLATVRHAGVLGEAVVTNFGGSSLVGLYLDGDNVADMTIQVVHAQGVVMNAGDFVL